MAGGRVVTYIYSSLGELEQVMMPLGSRYGFWRQAVLGVTKIGYHLPGYTEPYVTEWDVRGRLVLVRPPGGDGLLVYTWRGDGTLHRIIAGDRRTDYLYTAGQLSSVDHQRDGVNIKTSFTYNQGSVAFWRCSAVLSII